MSIPENKKAAEKTLRPLPCQSLPNVLGRDLNRNTWKQRRAEIQEQALDLLGTPPAERVSLNPQTLHEETCDGYRRLHVRFRSEPGDTVTAYLLVPDDLRTPGRAMIAVHTSASAGKDCTVGKTGLRPGTPPDRNRAYALDAVEHGYVVLAPDMDNIGERAKDGRVWDTQPFYERHPEWSAMGKVAWDLSRCVDYLATLDLVDPERVACMGHCFGAYCTVFGAAFEPRIKAVLINSGLWTFRSGRAAWSRDPNDPDQVASARRIHGNKAGVYVHIPKLAEYIGVGPDNILKPLPIDYFHILCLIPPRAIFLSAPSADIVYERENPDPKAAALSLEVTSQSCSALKQLYNMYGNPECFESWVFESEHNWKPEPKRKGFEFLDRVF